MNEVEQILVKHNTMTLATIGEKGASAAAIFYVFSKKDNAIIFLSNPKSEHIINLMKNPKCAATIQEDGLDWEKIKGLQIKGDVSIADEGNWTLYYERYPFIKNNEDLKATLKKVKLYMLKIRWIRIIDNKTGLGNNEEIEYN